MGVTDILRFAVRGVTANKLRSALTVLGVLIGVGAVILLVAVGTGSQKAIEDSIESLGTNTLTVSSSGGQGTSSYFTDLTLAMSEALEDKTVAPDVATVSPVVSSSSATAVYDGTEYDISSLIGTYPSYLDASNTSVASGSAFTQSDVDTGNRVLLIGSTVADELFAGTDPVGEQVTIGGALYTVTGVLADKGTTGFQDANDLAIAPLSAVQQTLTGYGSLSQLLIQATSADTVDAAETEVGAVLDGMLHVKDGDTAPYRISNQSQLLETRADTAATFTLLLGAVAGISLLVGGIGITNIMMVTVTERTREIGIRKALGAPRRVILTQFLAEATALSLLGGGLGVALAYVGSNFTIAGVEPVIVPSSVALALGVSVAIGLFFGGYPASRAAALRPIDALRYE